MSKLAGIRQFFENTNYAICGVSRNEKKFGSLIYKALKEKHFTVYPINPNTPTHDGDTCYATPSALPDKNVSLVVVVPKKQTFAVVKDAVDCGITQIWLQHGTHDEAAVAYARERGVNIVEKQCFFMFFDPVNSIHSFHAKINKLFGKYPK